MDNAYTTVSPTLLLKIPDVCDLLALGRSTVYLLIADGELDAVHIGRSVRITAESTRAFVERRKSQDQSAVSR